MRSIRAEVASDEAFLLAEGPVWDPIRQRVLWVDIDGGLVLEGRLEGNRVASTGRYARGGTVGAAVCAEDGRLLVAGPHTLSVLAHDGADEHTLDVIAPGQLRRLNDGACDPEGRFLVGSMALDGSKGSDCLYRLEDDLTLTVIDHDLTLSNGLPGHPTPPLSTASTASRASSGSAVTAPTDARASAASSCAFVTVFPTACVWTSTAISGSQYGAPDRFAATRVRESIWLPSRSRRPIHRVVLSLVPNVTSC